MSHRPLFNQFTMVAGSVVLLEVTLGAWPVVATAIWGSRAVDTWIHFLYWIKASFLFLAVVQYRWAAWKLSPQRHRPSVFERFMGMTVSCELGVWVLLSVVVHALLSFVLLLLVAVLRNEFLSGTQWGLSLAFDVVGILESLGSPMLVGQFAINAVQAPPAAPLMLPMEQTILAVAPPSPLPGSLPDTLNPWQLEAPTHRRAKPPATGRAPSLRDYGL